MSLRIAKHSNKPSSLKLAPTPDPAEPVGVVYSASTTGSGSPYYTLGSSSNYLPLSNTTYPNGGNTTGGNITYPDSPNQDSDDPTHLNPIDPDNDTVWNVARLTLYGKPEDNKKLREYMIAGWEPFSTIEKDHQQILFLRRLEVA